VAKHIEVLNVSAEGHSAAVHWRPTGTVTGGRFQGVHATGRPVDLRGCDVMRFGDGLLKHHIIYYDGLVFARQTGLLPTVGSPADRALQAVFNVRSDTLAQIQDLRW
jgi:hypothetical protein